MQETQQIVECVEAAVDYALATVGKELIVATPLGLGKPVQLLNAFYRRAQADSSISLHIHTALSLSRPKPGSDIEARLVTPILERLFGDYEELDYVAPFKRDALPENIQVTEYYFKAGAHKGHAGAQQSYVSSNYTHIMRDMLGAGANVLAQMMAARETDDGLMLSFACNTDLSFEVLEAAQAPDSNIVLLAQTHDALPYMEGEAEVPADVFDRVVRNPKYNNRLFSVPNSAIPLQDYATGLHASSLIVDGGTLQIGIGSLGDAVAQACIVRHRQNAAYRDLLSDLSNGTETVRSEHAVFDQGLYVSTEMFVNGMLHLIEQGIVKRKVYDNIDLQRGIDTGEITETVNQALYDYALRCGLLPRQLQFDDVPALQHWGLIGSEVMVKGEQLWIEGREFANDLTDDETVAALLAPVDGHSLRNGCILHGGFFLGPSDFYDKLNALQPPLTEDIRMTGVARTNQLLLDYPLYRVQRRDARFINTGMMVSLSGAVASDALEDGTVISGVGGQYNFVAMAHDLPGARSVLCIRSTRGRGSELKSNIMPFYGHTTIPKHLRDIIVTEYGVADLRGQSDAEVAKRLINVADSRFQDELLAFAQEHLKLPRDYRVPESARQNTPERLAQALEPARRSGLLPDYPFGTVMTEREQALASSLREIKALSEEPAHFFSASLKALMHRANPEAAKPFLERLELEHPQTSKEFVTQQLLLLELEERGLLKVN